MLNLLREANYVPRVANLSTTAEEGRGAKREREGEKTMKKQVTTVGSW